MVLLRAFVSGFYGGRRFASAKSPEASSERLTIMTEHSGAVTEGAGRGVVDIAQKFGRVTEHWSPKIIAESNGWQFKLVKASGEFIWHQHQIDAVFLVFAGQVTNQLRGADESPLVPASSSWSPETPSIARTRPRVVSDAPRARRRCEHRIRARRADRGRRVDLNAPRRQAAAKKV